MIFIIFGLITLLTILAALSLKILGWLFIVGLIFAVLGMGLLLL